MPQDSDKTYTSDYCTQNRKDCARKLACVIFVTRYIFFEPKYLREAANPYPTPSPGETLCAERGSSQAGAACIKNLPNLAFWLHNQYGSACCTRQQGSRWGVPAPSPLPRPGE